MAIGKLVSFRADDELQRRLEAYRKAEDRKMADVVRRLVIRALSVEERRAELKKARS